MQAKGAKSGFVSVISTSALTAKVLRKAATVVVGGRSSKVGQMSFTITVTANSESAVSGSVSIKQGSKTLKSSLALRKGTATYTSSKVSGGTHAYTVRFSGNFRVVAGEQDHRADHKAKSKPVITLKGSTTPGTVKVGITVTAKGEGKLGGNVSVKEGSNTLKGKVKVSKGKATYSAGK